MQPVITMQAISCWVSDVIPLVQDESVIVLLKKYAPNARLVSAASKYRAYERYLKDGEYVLTNKKNMVEADEAEILAEFQVKMVWCVYRIK